MNKLYASKEEYVRQCMDMLEGSYTSESGVFKKVEKALSKLNRDELSGLYSMLLCEVKVKEAKVPEEPHSFLNNYFGKK